MQLPFVIRAMGYAGLIPFVGLALSVQFADSPDDLIALESLVAYGAVIASFLGALHWGACFRTMGQNSHNRWLDHSVWIWGIIPALVAWLAIHVYIPLALLLLAITLIVQRMIDQSTYQNYFANEDKYDQSLLVSYAGMRCLSKGEYQPHGRQYQLKSECK